MLSNTEQGKFFQLRCCDALKMSLGRDIDMEISRDIGGGKLHQFDLATRERDFLRSVSHFRSL
jgi:hypothetical protein